MPKTQIAMKAGFMKHTTLPGLPAPRTHHCVPGHPQRGLASFLILLHLCHFVVLGPEVRAAETLGNSLTVQLAPLDAVAAGAQWRLAGEEDWRESGVAYTGLPVGLHVLEFKPLTDWIQPGDERPVRIQPGESIILGPLEYQPLPVFPVQVTASPGGRVVYQHWEPLGFRGLFPIGVDGGDDSLSREWLTNLRLGLRSRPLPRENGGVRMRIHAIAFPGYRFAGWVGDTRNSANPLAFIITAPRRHHAVFEWIGSGVTATHSADAYTSPGTVVLHCQFNYGQGDQLDELIWHPELPDGWALVGAHGLGDPTLDGSSVVFPGPLGFNPLQFNLVVKVPTGQSGNRAISGTVEYTLFGETVPQVKPIESQAGSQALILTESPSTAARLELSASGGSPSLTLHGAPGKTYAIEQVSELTADPPFNRLWWFTTDVTLTNSIQTVTDPTPILAFPHTFYRATALE
ncbi:MAG: hypothetical protein RI897_65 [Verrucomicrobiota bacterium]|jgi:hypothetical protein